MASAPKLNIAVIQFQPKSLSPDANFTTAAQYLRSAASQGCHLAVLPEFHLTSWLPDHPDFIASCRESFPYLDRYRSLARELNIHIVPGTIIEPAEQTKTGTGDDPDPTLELRNLAYFIAAGTGDIIDTYQKKNLWHEERGVLTAGTHTPHRTFDVPVPSSSSSPSSASTIRVGLLICWDLSFPEPFRELVADGAEMVIVPMFWAISGAGSDAAAMEMNPRCEEVFIDSLAVARAYESGIAVVVCNALGCSQVAVPILGRLESGMDGGEEEGRDGWQGVMLREVDFRVVRYAERIYKIRGDLSGEGWHYTRVATRGRF